MSEGETVRPEFTKEQADALLTYTETAIQGDDTFDEFRKNVSEACDELENSLRNQGERNG